VGVEMNKLNKGDKEDNCSNLPNGNRYKVAGIDRLQGSSLPSGNRYKF